MSQAINRAEDFELAYVEVGWLRAYYRPRGQRGPLYCIQNEGAWGGDRFVWLVCSSDGEPSHEVAAPDGWEERLLAPVRAELSLTRSC